MTKRLELIGPHFADAGAMLDWSSMQLDCYGDLSPSAGAIMGGMGVRPRVHRRRGGFSRLT